MMKFSFPDTAVALVVSIMIASSANALLTAGPSAAVTRNAAHQQFYSSCSSSAGLCRPFVGTAATKTADANEIDTSSSSSNSQTSSSSPVEKSDELFAEADSLFDMLDTNNDGGISNEELKSHLESIGFAAESIRSLFTILDKNADGIISKAEMRFAWSKYDTANLYKAFGLDINDTGTPYNEVIESIRSDANNKNNNNNNDITEAVSTSPELLTKLADIIFDSIDTDRSEEIDAEELRMHFRVNGTNNNEGTTIREIGHASSVRAESLLKALDLNLDGVISRQEMRDGFNQYDPRTLSRALGLHVS
jgi:Ca2+-binding EF-hand superfamily protein